MVDAAGEVVRLGGFHLSPSVPESAHAEASTQAVQDARARAERLAVAAGVRVGRVLSITEDSTQSAARPLPMTAAAMPARAMPR